jgi:hypothetical protein
MKTVSVFCIFCVHCVLLANLISGQVPDSPCPDVFMYYKDGYTWYGQISVQNPSLGVLRIDVELFLPAVVYNVGIKVYIKK